MDAAINQAEVDRRVAIIKRFKELLERQRERLRSYLALLEKQETVIGSGGGEEIMAHVELEEQIVADIFSIQKVMSPMEDMYRAVAPLGPADAEIPALKTALEDAKVRVQAQSAKNRELLSARMDGIRVEVDALKENPFTRGSGYGDSAAPSFIDVEG